MMDTNRNVHEAAGYQAGNAYCTWEDGQHAECVDASRPLWRRPAFWATMATLAAFAGIFIFLARLRG